MLIRKTQQPSTYPENQIHDAYSTSATDTYSCDYINSHNLKSSIIHQVTPTNGTNHPYYGGTYYYKVGSRVHVHVGISINVQSYTVIFTLPVGFRPKTILGFVGVGSSLDNFAGLQIDPSGPVAVIAKNGYVLADMDFDTFES